jgi:glycosyltransferase involved in cell wall biosynthesis
MAERRFKVLAIATHPVQYQAPLLRRMNVHPQLDLQVAYCSLRGAKAGYDPEFGAQVQWDVPLLDGYKWVEVPNKGSGGETFFGLNNPGLRQLILDGKFDAVLCFLPYVRASFWIARRAAKATGAAFLFGTDAHTLTPLDKRMWKIYFKKVFWPFLFGMADQVMAPSSGTVAMFRRLGIPAERITFTPYCVDNDWWKAQGEKVDREAVRAKWGVTPEQPAILFCAKLQPWKRPTDLLRAFAQADVANSILVFAGEGPLRSELETEAKTLGVSERVRFLGFVNQSQLPALYCAADMLALPSDYDAFGVVVNEAMCCRCAVIVSDKVGASRDLVAPVRPDFVFPAGDVGALAKVLRDAFADREKLRETVQRAYDYVEEHSPQRNVDATVEAVAKGVEHKGSRR